MLIKNPGPVKAQSLRKLNIWVKENRSALFILFNNPKNIMFCFYTDLNICFFYLCYWSICFFGDTWLGASGMCTFSSKYVEKGSSWTTGETGGEMEL